MWQPLLPKSIVTICGYALERIFMILDLLVLSILLYKTSRHLTVKVPQLLAHREFSLDIKPRYFLFFYLRHSCGRTWPCCHMSVQHWCLSHGTNRLPKWNICAQHSVKPTATLPLLLLKWLHFSYWLLLHITASCMDTFQNFFLYIPPQSVWYLWSR